MSDAVDWLAWQQEHADALKALQQAQQLYHRLKVDRAFGVDDDGRSREARQALEAMDAARRHLDDVRGRQPR